MPNEAKVYPVGINESRLLTLDRVQQKLSGMGFTDQPIQVNDQSYLFIQNKIGSKLVYNVVSGGFSYSYDWTNDTQVTSSHNIPVGADAISQAKDYLNSVGSLSEDLVSGNAKLTYLIISGSALIPTDSVYDANIVRVDLFRADKDQMPIVTVGGDTSPIEVMISGLTDEKKVVQANFQYSQVLDNDYATYPIITPQQAWTDLTKGRAYVAKRTVDNVIIRKVSLAYFESNDRRF